MAPIKIDTKEDLANTLTDYSDTVEGVAAKQAEIEATLAEKEAEQKEKDEKFAEMVATMDALNERLKSITLATTSVGSWKTQNTPEAKAYKMGQFIQAISEARHGSAIARKRLGAVGSQEVKDVGGADCKVSTIQDDEGRWKSYGSTDEKMQENVLATKAGLSSSPLTGDDSVGSYNGSYTVPVEYRSELERISMDASAMMSKVSRVTVPGITSYLPTSTDEFTFTKVTNQNTDKTEDTLTLNRMTLTTEIYAAYIAIVEEFFEDTLIDVGNTVQTMFGEAWGKKFDSLCLEDSTYGAINATGINLLTMGAGSSSFDDVSIDDMHNMVKELDTRWKRSGGEFFMHPTVFDFIAEEKDADGNYRLRMPQDSAPRRVRGYNVTETDGLPDNPNDDAVSTRFMLFGNPRRIYNGQRVGFEFRIYDQTQSNMESGQVFLRVRTRQAFAVSLPSCFVALRTAAE